MYMSRKAENKNFQQSNQMTQRYIVFNCSEEEFFESEIKDMILKLLQDEKQKMDEDPNQKGWRRYRVLEALLKGNKVVGKGKETDIL